MQEKMTSLCPVNCPFLAIRSFIPSSMPFYCGKFQTYLGMTPAKKVMRCSLCQGLQPDIIQTGLSLLEAQKSHSNELKQAFLKLLPVDQIRLVSLLTHSGLQFNFPKGQVVTPALLNTQIQKLIQTYSKYELSTEHQDFIKLLKLLADAGTPMDPMVQSLLSNLFQVIDGSEKAMLLAIMENPARLKAFLKQFSKIPQNQDMLKNFRALLYDYDRQRQQEQTRSVGIRHLMRGMSRVRMVRQKNRAN